MEIPKTFEAESSFDVRLVNHGTSLHVHLHLDDTLSQVATLEASNHYVESDSERAVRISVDTERIPDDGLFGRLKVVSAYGAETRWIDIELSQPTPTTQSVQVDESLTKPPEPDPDTTRSGLVSAPELPVLALGGLALVVAILAAAMIQNVLVTVGAGAVIGGVLVALFVLLRE